jgi:hypothetical protein
VLKIQHRLALRKYQKSTKNFRIKVCFSIAIFSQ